MLQEPKSSLLAMQLRRAVSASGLTGRQLAHMSGLPDSTISRLKYGNLPTVATAERVAGALGLDIQLVPRGRGRGKEGRQR